jgi:GT2 family glycosyltransferase
MNQVKVDIILVSYNTAEYTLKALASVYNETEKGTFNLIVVDNNSQDDSVIKIKQHFPQITLISSDRNLGFAGGVNLATSYAKSDYILLLNPDTVILDHAIDRLLEFAQEQPQQGIWGGITLNNDLSINSHNAWSEETISTLLFSVFGLNRIFKHSCFFNRANYGCWQRDSIKEVDVLQGSFFLTSKVLWDQLNGLDERFFMYAEEADYCYRAKKLHHRPLITPDAQIIHHGGGSETNLAAKMIRLLTGKTTFINKHHTVWRSFIMKSLLFAYICHKLILSTLLSLMQRDKENKQREWWTVFKSSTTWLRGYQ